MSDRLQSEFRRVVRTIIGDMERQVAPGIVEARGVERLMMIVERDELPAERMRRENAAAMREMEALGNTRDSAMQIAKRRTENPHTQEILAQRFRRLRRTKNKRAVLA